jgi:hypothetical protein
MSRAIPLPPSWPSDPVIGRPLPLPSTCFEHIIIIIIIVRAALYGMFLCLHYNEI